MAASPQLDTVLGMIRARAAETRKTIEDDRASYERMLSSMPLDDDITTERVGAGGVPAEWIAAPGAEEQRILLYLQGEATPSAQ
jgi:monoterpene epsilon-lactone hydrolase